MELNHGVVYISKYSYHSISHIVKRFQGNYNTFYISKGHLSAYEYILFSGRSRWPRFLRRGSAAASLLAGGLEFRRGCACLSLVSVRVVGWRSLSGSSLVQRSSTERSVSECDREASIMRRSWSTKGCCAMEYA